MFSVKLMSLFSAFVAIAHSNSCNIPFFMLLQNKFQRRMYAVADPSVYLEKLAVYLDRRASKKVSFFPL